MATDTSLVGTRVAICEALKKTVKDFDSETSAANISGFCDLPIIKRYQSIIEAGNKAVTDLNVFWRNLRAYSTTTNPKYIDVRIIVLKNNDSSKVLLLQVPAKYIETG
jgi:hypothetical protein